MQDRFQFVDRIAGLSQCQCERGILGCLASENVDPLLGDFDRAIDEALQCADRSCGHGTNEYLPVWQIVERGRVERIAGVSEAEADQPSVGTIARDESIAYDDIVTARPSQPAGIPSIDNLVI